MKIRKTKYEEVSPLEFLALREKLNIGRYKKERSRDDAKKKLLRELALKKMDEIEKDDYILVGERKRRLKID
ncbi:MAG: hypothetical protein OEV42_03700 [Deltaproteobacteria bacterium]|nr:hypothetical protein [Deltaproteobacteria bacterium]